MADRFSRRRSLLISSLLQALGFALWILEPGFRAFAAGFVVWGLGGALASGAFEALVYESLSDFGAEQHYARLNGRINAAVLLAEIPTAVAATALFRLGGYSLVGWVSVGICLASSLLATRLSGPFRPHLSAEPGDSVHPDRAGYLSVLRGGVSAALAQSPVRFAVIVLVVVGGLDALDEYFPLMAHDWGVPATWVPIAILGLPIAGAFGSALGGRTARLGPWTLSVLFAGALIVLGTAALIAVPAGLAGVTVFYGLQQMMLVTAEARLQERIEGSSRATATSVARLGTELLAIVLFGAWALNGILLVVGLWLVLGIGFPRWLGGVGIIRLSPGDGPETG